MTTQPKSKPKTQPLNPSERDLFLAIAEQDLAKFQTAYLHLLQLGQRPEVKEWPVPCMPGFATSTTFQICLRWGNVAVCEQNFRFSLLCGGDLLRSSSSAPLIQVAGAARCLSMAECAHVQEEAEFYATLLERFIATLYQVVFERHPALLGSKAIVTHLEQKDSWERMADLVLDYQSHYEGMWRSGQATAEHLCLGELLDSGSDVTVLAA